MKEDVINQFLKAYLSDGVVAECITVLQKRYDFDILQKTNPLSNTLKTYYYKTLPNKIEAETVAALDNYAIDFINNSLIEEIKSNLSECETTRDKERYIHSLITPFEELSDFLYSTDTRLEKIRERYMEILQASSHNLVEGDGTFIVDGTSIVEESLSLFIKMAQVFASQLDALLLKKGIDFMRLQKECGIYLIKCRDITDVAYKKEIGKIELIKTYISELPNDNQPEHQLETDHLNDKNKNADKPQRKINSEKLSPYFKPTFKGAGNRIDFFCAFCDELKTNRTAKEFAQIALMCFKGTQMTNRKPATFQKWYRFFCECADCEWKKNYDNMNTLRDSTKEELKALFGYLQ